MQKKKHFPFSPKTKKQSTQTHLVSSFTQLFLTSPSTSIKAVATLDAKRSMRRGNSLGTAATWNCERSLKKGHITSSRFLHVFLNVGQVEVASHLQIGENLAFRTNLWFLHHNPWGAVHFKKTHQLRLVEIDPGNRDHLCLYSDVEWRDQYDRIYTKKNTSKKLNPQSRNSCACFPLKKTIPPAIKKTHLPSKGISILQWQIQDPGAQKKLCSRVQTS